MNSTTHNSVTVEFEMITNFEVSIGAVLRKIVVVDFMKWVGTNN